MDFRNGRESGNVEDRRGAGGRHLGRGGRIGIGTILLALVAFFGRHRLRFSLPRRLTRRWIVPATKRTTHAAELLDGPLTDPLTLRDNLRDMARANRWGGGVGLSRRAIRAVAPTSGPVTLLDVGTGGADIPVALLADARRGGLDLRVTAVDGRAEVLDAARLATPTLDEVPGLGTRAVTGLRAFAEMMSDIRALAESGAGPAEILGSVLDRSGYLAELRAITPQKVQEVAQRVLRADARVVQHAIPRKTDGSAAAAAAEPEKKLGEDAGHPQLTPADPWRAQPPPSLAAKLAALPVAQREVLENGLTVLAVPRPGLPLVSLALVSRHGGEQDPNGKEGQAALAGVMLSEGMDGQDAAANLHRAEG